MIGMTCRRALCGRVQGMTRKRAAHTRQNTLFKGVKTVQKQRLSDDQGAYVSQTQDHTRGGGGMPPEGRAYVASPPHPRE